MTIRSINRTQLEQKLVLYKVYGVLIQESTKRRTREKLLHNVPLEDLFKVKWLKFQTDLLSDDWEILAAVVSLMNLGVDDVNDPVRKFAFMQSTGSPLLCTDVTVVKSADVKATFQTAGRTFERKIVIPDGNLEKEIAKLRKLCAPFFIGCYEF